MAFSTTPVLSTTTVGAAPLVAFKSRPSPNGRVVYGALQEFQVLALLACMFWMITSVPVMVSPTPGQVPEQPEETFVPAASKDAVEPDGGSTSMKLTPRFGELPVRLTVIELVPPAPLRL